MLKVQSHILQFAQN